MNIKRVKEKPYAELGSFLIEALVYVDGDGTMRKVMSRPIGEEDLKKFLQICADLRGTQSESHTIFAIGEMKDGKVLAGQFGWTFENNWPLLGSLRRHKIYQVTEKGLDEVEVTL